MPAIQTQYGLSNWRINREPIDAETVHLSYSDMQNKLVPNSTGIIPGAFYGGLITSVTNDSNNAYNGPWYISVNKQNRVSYLAERIPVRSEIDFELYSVLEKPKYTKPEMTVQFLSAANGKDLTTVSEAPVIYEDIEVMSYFIPGFKINWPKRTLENESGTRANNEKCDPSIPNELLGYSYGVAPNGISFNCLGVNHVAYSVDSVIRLQNGFTTKTEGEYVVFDNLQISYLPASYMYYPQFYNNGRYEFSYGEGDTKWFGKGVYIPSTTKYVVNAKWKYYWGLSDNVPENEEQLKSKKSGFLNNSTLPDGTITSTLVGEDYKCKSFWVAFPKEFILAPLQNGLIIQLELSDGTFFDLVSETQKVQLKKMNIHLGDNKTIKEYNVAFIKFEWPIGNKSAIISFKIIPENLDIIYNMNFENGMHTLTEYGTDILRTESSKNSIYDEDIFS